MSESGEEASHSEFPSTSLSLLESIRNKDAAAWQALVSLYGPLVYNWCRQRRFSPDACEVIGQEVFLAVHTNLIGFRKTDVKDTFRGWLRQITLFKCADYIENQAHEPIAIGGSDWNAAVNGMPSSEGEEVAQSSQEVIYLYTRAVELIRSEFNDVNFGVFIEVVAKERPPKDVAAEFGISVNSVYLTKSRVLKRVKQLFADILPVIEEDGHDDLPAGATVNA